MKRYDPTHSCRMKENGEGRYVRYEDVVDIVELLLNECGQDEIEAESFVKEWE